MKRLPLLSNFFPLLSCSAVLLCSPSMAQESHSTATPATLNTTMQALGENFLGILPYLSDQQKFDAPQEGPTVQKYLEGLLTSLHRADSVPSKYKNRPSFMAVLNVTQETLQDALARFKEGKKEYAYWRLRNVTSACITCHTSHGLGMSAQHLDTSLKNLPPAVQAEGYLVTRQYEKAEPALLKALNDKKVDISQSLALFRKWLILHVLIKGDPKETQEKLTEVLPRLGFTSFEGEEVYAWKRALEQWEKEKEEKTTPHLQTARNLLFSPYENEEVLASRETQVISALRALRITLPLLSSEATSMEERRKALFYTGVAHEKLPLFFLSNAAELYFLLCIEEFPKTTEAQDSFQHYRSLIEDKFMGVSASAALPKELQERLNKLYRLAFQGIAYS